MKQRDVFREIRNLGFVIENGKKHYRVLDSAGRQVAVLPRSTHGYGGPRGWLNIRAQLHRWGKENP